MPKTKFTCTHLILWSIVVMVILVVGIYYFPIEEPGLNFWGALYYTLRLFIMEHDLTRFPDSRPLVVIYFLAPVAALSVLGTLITYLFKFSPALRNRYLSDHVVVCGVGRTGRLMVETLRENDVMAVGIDRESGDSFEPWCSQNKVRMIRGDFLLQPVMEKARVSEARAVVFASGDDLLNLEAAVALYGWLFSETKAFKVIWVHIANEKLADRAREAIRTQGKIGIRFFDTYRIAARRMLHEYFPADIAKRAEKVYILGFGKFGRDLFEILIREYREDFSWPIVVVDKKDRQREVFELAREFHLAREVTFIHNDIRQLHPKEEDRAFFVCTDDDIGNLAMALSLTRNMNRNQCQVFVRMSKWPLPAIEEHLSEGRGITFININDLVRTAIADLAGLLAPATKSDLKRHGTAQIGTRD